MDKIKNRISEEQLKNQILTKNDFLYLMTDMSVRHVSISGMGVFTLDFNFSFIVSALQFL